MIKVQEDNYKECHRELAGMKQKITMGAGVASMLMMWFFSTQFSGKLIGTLPFVPAGMISSISHRGLEGDDMSEYSMMFVFVVLQMALRGSVSKLMGNEAPRMPIEHQTPKWLQDMANPDQDS